MKKKFFIVFRNIFIFSVMFLTCARFVVAATGVPSVISYQGRLADANGLLLGGTGTNYFFKFSIWDNSTVGSGTKLWPSSTPGTVTLSVAEGVFNVNIGDTSNGYPDALTYNFQDNDNVYLQVEVSTNGSTFETLGPRQRITASGMAINARTLGGLLPSYFLDANNLTNFNTPFDTAFSTKTTDTLSEGATNKYFTTSLFNSNFASKSTSNLAEGTNLYYTDARARSALSAVGPLSYVPSTGVFSIAQSSGSTSGYLTSTDWNTFNNKQNTITVGTSAQYLKGDLTLGTFPTVLSDFTNDQGFIMGITSGNVTTALGYTPYDATNPDGYITATSNDTLTNKSGDISQWINDSGYITSGPLSDYVPTTRTINGYALSSDITLTKSDLSLGNVEDIALSTWAGTTNITTLGTIATGVWQGTAIADGYIASASTWNAKEDALTFSTGLTRTSNTITNNLSTGVSGGQTVYGGTGSGDNLVLRSTTNATRGNVKIDTTSGGFNFRDYLGSIPAIYPGSNVTAGSDGFILASFGTTSMFYGSGGAASLYHYVSGGNRTLLTSSYYNIGVNTSIGLTLGTTPSAKLHLESGTAELQTMGASILLNQKWLGVNTVGLRIYQTPDAGNQETGRMYMRLTNGSSATLGIRMEFSTLQRSTMVLTPRMVIDNLGQVGIGTTSGVDATSKLEVRTDALGVTQTTSSGLALTNTTAAALAAQQISPALRWSGKGWGTTASTSQAADFRAYILPVQGAAQPSGELLFESAFGSSSYQRAFSVGDTTAAAGGISASVYGNGTQGQMRIYAGQASSFNQLGIGVTVGTSTLDGASNAVALSTNSTQRLTVFPTTGFVGIGTAAFTPTSKVEVRTNSLGVTQTTDSGLALTNTTAAAAGAQQISPALRWSGSGWKTATTAASQAVDFRQYLLPTQGTANPTGALVFESSVNGGAYDQKFRIDTSGTATVPLVLQSYFGYPSFYSGTAAANSSNFSIAMPTDNLFLNAPTSRVFLTVASDVILGLGSTYGDFRKSVLIDTSSNGSTAPAALLEVKANSLGVTPNNTTGTVALVNSTAAALGAQQISPALRWSGKGWGTTGSTSQAADFRAYILPVQGAAQPSGELLFESAFGSSSYQRAFSVGDPTAAAGGISASVYGNGTQGQMRIYAGQASSFNQLGISVTVGTSTLDGASNAVAISTNSTQRLTVFPTTGFVGIGTAAFTPTSKVEVRTNSLGVTQTTDSGLALTNTTAAAAGAQQISPALRWSGQGWKTTATAASQSVDFRSYVVPVQGAANPSGYLTWDASINGGASTPLMYLFNSGQLSVASSGGIQLSLIPGATPTIATGGSQNIAIAPNNVTAMTVALGGNVGIGQTVPTSKLDVTTNSLGVTQTTSSGLALVNTTAAAAGAQQISPAVRFTGNGWKTNATAASQAVDFRNYLLPVQGSANPSSSLVWESSINGGAYSQVMTLSSAGGLGIAGGLSIGASASILPTSGNITLSSFSTTNVSANGSASTFALVNSGLTSLTGQSRTGSSAISLLEMTQTWNTSGVPTLIKATVTNTASGTGSKVMDLIVGSTSVFNVGVNGNVGIGATAPLNLLQVTTSNTAGSVAYMVNTGTGASDSVLDLGVGAATADTSNLFTSFYQGSTGASKGTLIGYIQGNSGAVNYSTTSDARLKENIVDTTKGLSDLLKIEVKDYNFISNPGVTTQGFIAQQLNTIYPYAVANNGDDGVSPLEPGKVPWGVDYGRITPLIVKSIQDMNLKVTNIEDISDSSTFKAHIIAWLGDVTNGIGKIFAGDIEGNKVNAKDELCVGQTCVTEDQLKVLLQQAGQAPVPQTQTPPITDVAPSVTPSSDPVITPSDPVVPPSDQAPAPSDTPVITP